MCGTVVVLTSLSVALCADVLMAGILPIEFGQLQSVAARGQVLCGGKPYKGAKIKLYDVDMTDLDDLMAQTFSDENGTFALEGSETEMTSIDPKLNIYHNCEDEAVECVRKVEIEIPDSFIARGDKADRMFDAGVLNLSAELPGETRDCLNKRKKRTNGENAPK